MAEGIPAAQSGQSPDVAVLQGRAEAGDAEAMNSLGDCYRFGDGVLQDCATAVAWYRQAAEAGNAAAMNNLGSCYVTGEGVLQDYARAAGWFQKGAEAGRRLSDGQPGLLL